MLLAQMGAQVLRMEHPTAPDPLRPFNEHDHLNRGRPSLTLDLKDEQDRAMALDLAEQADVLIEGYRPGVMERLGLGPAEVQARKPALVYGRMTGWGQDGPLAHAPGHDINYLALTGALAAIGPRDGPPSVPLNLVADFGGGAMYLVSGVLAALIEARTTGVGRIVDAAMVDGAASLMTMHYGYFADGRSTDRRGDNRLDGAHPCYAVYETSDGDHVAVGAMEAPFYRALLAGLGLDAAALPDRADKANWPALKEQFAAVFRTRSRDDWDAVFDGTEACVTPVLSMAEAPAHRHAVAREAFSDHAGARRPRAGAAPRFSTGEATAATPWPVTTAQRERLNL